MFACDEKEEALDLPKTLSMPFVEGLALSGYRSFGDDVQFMGPFTNINVFIGQNNSGKSNILSFIHDHLHEIKKALSSEGWTPKATDLHRGSQSEKFVVALGLKENNSLILRNILANSAVYGTSDAEAINTILSYPKFPASNGVKWFIHEAYKVGGKLEPANSFYSDYFDNALPQPVINAITHLHRKRNLPIQWTPNSFSQILNPINPIKVKYARAFIVPAIRTITEGEIKDGDFSGMGLV